MCNSLVLAYGGPLRNPYCHSNNCRSNHRPSHCHSIHCSSYCYPIDGFPFHGNTNRDPKCVSLGCPFRVTIRDPYLFPHLHAFGAANRGA